MKGKITTYSSYGNFFSSCAEVFEPTTTLELRTILHHLRKTGRKITVAGGFNSFDEQNGSKDAVISLKHFNTIHLNPEEDTITVGAGATWGAIQEVVYAHQYVLYTCVTGAAPTAGGTLSIHANSTFTPSMGKEGRHCLSFDIMLTSGEVLTCSRNQNQDLFYGAIAGFGLLGFIIKITYKIFHVGSHYKIDFAAKDYHNIDALRKVDWVKAIENISTLDDIKSQGCLFYMDGNTPKFSTYWRKYIRTKKKKEGNPFLFWTSTFLSGLWRLFPSLPNMTLRKDAKKPKHRRFILKGLDAIKEGTFWAQPDYIWTKKVGTLLGRIGYQPKLYQHSYFIPDEQDKLVQFTKKVFELIEQYGLQFFMFDISYLPKDEPFLFSSSRQSGGFYINSTFMDTTNEKKLMHCYSILNELAYEMRGSLNLGKNVFARPALLEKMFKTGLEELIVLKEKYDPNHLITSTFFEKNFPSYARYLEHV